MTVVRGGKPVTGVRIGILMLETRFPRPVGDAGNALTWPFPVLFKVVQAATPERVIVQSAQGLLDAFIDAGRELVDAGVDAIATNCGFLVLYQDELKQALKVPVASSSLLQIPSVEALLPDGQRAGVVTVSRQSLSEKHLIAAGARADTPVVGTEGGRELSRVLLGDELVLDTELARQDVVDAAHKLVEEHPKVGAIVLECTNMVPYARAVADSLGKPVYSIRTLVSWLHGGVAPVTFEGT